MFAPGNHPVIEFFEYRVEASCGVSRQVDGAAQVWRAAFRHLCLSALKITALRHRRVHPGKGLELLGGAKALHIPNFSQNRRAQRHADAGDGVDELVVFHQLLQEFVEFPDLAFDEIQLFKEHLELELQGVTAETRSNTPGCLGLELLRLFSGMASTALLLQELDELVDVVVGQFLRVGALLEQLRWSGAEDR